MGALRPRSCCHGLRVSWEHRCRHDIRIIPNGAWEHGYVAHALRGGPCVAERRDHGVSHVQSGVCHVAVHGWKCHVESRTACPDPRLLCCSAPDGAMTALTVSLAIAGASDAFGVLSWRYKETDWCLQLGPGTEEDGRCSGLRHGQHGLLVMRTSMAR